MQYQAEIFAKIVEETPILTPKEKEVLMNALPNIPQEEKDMLMNFLWEWTQKINKVALDYLQGLKQNEQKEKLQELEAKHGSIEEQARAEAEEILLNELS